MEYAVIYKHDGREMELGVFDSDGEARDWYASYLAKHPKELSREHAVIERISKRVVWSHDAGPA